MRYKEIVEYKIDNTSSDKIDQYSQEKQFGKGVEAKVYRDPSNPSVVKILSTSDSLKDNGYMQYILFSRKYANQNPYFPRIHSIEQNKNPDGTTTFVVKMEQLFPVSSLSKKQLFSIHKNTFINGDRHVISSKDDMLISLGDEFDVATDPSWGWSASKVSLDPNFIDACNLIRKIKNRTNSQYDLGTPNIMVRRSNYGFQLVITDPLSPKEENNVWRPY
jgi:hypothetical protein